MTRPTPANVAHSVHGRLLNEAQHSGTAFNDLLQNYLVERFVARLSRSEVADRFVLKGATMFRVWATPRARRTRDVDLLSLEAGTPQAVTESIRACLSMDDPTDGIRFAADSLVSEELAHDDGDATLRLRVPAFLGTARLTLHVDVGFGDVITPAAVWVDFPTLLSPQRPRVLGYPKETAIAEKFEAMVRLDLINTRLKDFHDIWALSRDFAFEGATLGRALAATFTRRATELPAAEPSALTSVFLDDPAKVRQWAGFVRKSGTRDSRSLPDVGSDLRDFLVPLTRGMSEGRTLPARWPPSGPWMQE